MIDFFQPENFQTLASFIMWAVGGTCLLISALAAWTLKYIIDIARDMAETKTSCKAMAASLSEFKQENERDHGKFEDRFTKVEDVNTEQGLLIHALQNKGC